MLQNVVKPTEPVIGRVVATRLCTAGGSKAAGFVRHVEISVAGTPLAGAFRAGQSFSVLPPGNDPAGRPHKPRLYSIAAPTRGEDGQGAVLSTTVKRLLDEDWETHRLRVGVASNYLCDLQPGDDVRVAGPSGKRFLLPTDPARHDLVFFATGTGIAPFRAMLGDLEAAGFPGKATLVMGVPYATELLYHDELTALAARQPRFRYLTALSRQPQADTPRPLYVADRIAYDPSGPGPDSLRDMLASDRTLIYICGIAGMELGVLRALAAALPAESLAQYLTVDPQIAADPAAWTRPMINRQLTLTRRVMMEVY